jgi:hypothetical protein
MTLVVKDYFTGSTNVTKSYSEDMAGIDIVNDSTTRDLTLTVNGISIPVKATEEYNGTFIPFRSLNVVATDVFRATVSAFYSSNGTTTITPDTTPPTVVVSPNGGVFRTSQSVTLSPSEPATIFYTLDGSTPTASSAVYTGALNITSTTTLKFFAKDTSGNTSAVQTSIFAQDLTAPNEVTNLQTSNLTSTSVTLTWTASDSPDVASYDVFNGSTLVANITGTTYNVTGLTAGTAYTLWVKTKDAVGNESGGVSAPITTSALADTTPPANVTNLAYSNVTQTGVTLTWTASSSTDTAAYDIYNGATLLGSVVSTTYNVTGLSSGTPYTFKVVARDGSGNVSTGVTINVTTNAIPQDLTPPTVTASPNGGSFSSAQTVTLTANEPATIYYTLDGSTPTMSSTQYTASIGINSTTTLKYFAVDTAGNPSDVQTATYTFTIVTPVVTISPAAGSYTSAQSVTLTCTNVSGATIFYTLDGTTPTVNSGIYSAPINITSTTTIKYFAQDSVGNSSTVSTAVYTISAPQLTITNTNGLVSAWNFGNVTSGTTVPDLVGTNNMTMSGFTTSGPSLYGDGGIIGDNTGTIKSGNLLTSVGSFTVAITIKGGQNKGNENFIKLNSELNMSVPGGQYSLTANATSYSFGNNNYAKLNGYWRPYRNWIETVAMVVDATANTVTLYRDGVRMYQAPYTPAVVPALGIYDGGYGPGSNTGRGLYTSLNAAFYNRALSDAEVTTLYNDLKQPQRTWATTNDLTSVGTGLLDAYDYTGTVPSAPPLQPSEVGWNAQNFTNVTAVGKASDGSLTTVSGASTFSSSTQHKGKDSTFVLKAALTGATTGDILKHWGTYTRVAGATGVFNIALKSSGATVNLISVPSTDVNIHTFTMTMKDNGTTGYDLAGYLDGVKTNLTGSMTYAQTVSNVDWNLAYPLGSGAGTELQSSTNNIQKYATLSYDRVLTDAEIAQVHTDLMN